MRSNLIELSPELFDQDLRIDPVLEPLHAETLIAEFAVEAFRDAILPGFAGLDQRRADALGDDPGQQGLGYELRSVVGQVNAPLLDLMGESTIG